METLKHGNQLYASFPSQFNDIHDSQIRLSSKSIHAIAEKLKLYFGTSYDIAFLENSIRYHIDQLSFTNISCFSELDPLSISSNHMWGLYAACGSGIAIQYDIDELILWEKNDTELNDSGCMVNVAYPSVIDYPNHNKVDFLYSLFKTSYGLIKESSLEAIRSQQFDVLSIKTPEWQYEKEWRVIFLANTFGMSELGDDFSLYSNDPVKFLLAHKKKMPYKDKIFNFIQPARIVLGWNFDNNDDLNKGLLNFVSKQAKIELIRLDKTVDYNTSKFNPK